MIMTAKEFLEDAPFNGQYWEEKLIAFAQMHVKAALEAVSKKADTKMEKGVMNEYRVVDIDSILNSYPLTNVK